MFSDLAPKYWEKGISVIPLKYKSKIPVLANWNRFCSSLPTPEEQTQFLAQYKENNIGLALGIQSNIMVVDIDTDSQEVNEAIMSCLPKSPWERIGKKGRVLAFKFNGNGTERIHGVINGKESTIVEILSTGAQVVLPPSIHPDTLRAYTSNCELVDVYDSLPMLPVDAVARIRAVVGQIIELSSSQSAKKFSTTEFVSSGARDNQMNRNAGFLAHSVLRGEMSVKAALSDMLTWCELRVHDVVGDNLDVKKGQGQVIQYILHDVTVKGKILPNGWDEGLTEEEKKSWGFVLDEDHTEWTVEQHLEYIDKLSNTMAKNSPERHQGEYSILKKLSKSISLNTLDVDRVLTALQKSGSGQKAILKKQIKELQAGPVVGISHTEIAQALISEITKKRGQIAYHNGTLWCWNGSHWEELKEQVVREFLQNEFGSLDLAKKGNDHRQIVNVLKDQVPQRLTVDTVSVVGVNYANGFQNKNLKLVPHSPDFGMTYTLPFRYAPELAGKCPKFFKYLEYSWGADPDYDEKKKALQEVICTTLFGIMPSFSKCVLLYGTPGSGKSVLMSIVSALVPVEARCAMSPERWGEENYALSIFSGKLLNIAGELDNKKKINGKLFKEIVSGEEITTRGPYKDFFQMKPKAAHWFCSNYLPQSTDTSNGFNRRWMIFNFSRFVQPQDVILDLDKEIIYEEMEAIIAWALESFPDLMKRNAFTLSESHSDILKEMSLQNSDIRQWMEHIMEVKDDETLPYSDAYKSYNAYCLTVLQMKSLSPKGFSIAFDQMLLEKGISGRKVDDKDQYYLGVTLKRTKK